MSGNINTLIFPSFWTMAKWVANREERIPKNAQVSTTDELAADGTTKSVKVHLELDEVTFDQEFEVA